MNHAGIAHLDRHRTPLRYSFGNRSYSTRGGGTIPASADESTSVLVADARLRNQPLALSFTLESLPEATLVPDHHRLSSSGERELHVAVAGASRDAVDETLMSDPSVTCSRHVASFPEYHMYCVHLDDEALLVAPTSVELGARTRSIRGTDGVWQVRFEFPDRDALVALRTFCEERGIRFGVESLYRTDRFDEPVMDLTEPQWRALSTAFEGGYYDIPRKMTQDELAEELGISTSAVSHRLRRGTAQLIRETIAALGEHGTPQN